MLEFNKAQSRWTLKLTQTIEHKDTRSILLLIPLISSANLRSTQRNHMRCSGWFQVQGAFFLRMVTIMMNFNLWLVITALEKLIIKLIAIKISSCAQSLKFNQLLQGKLDHYYKSETFRMYIITTFLPWQDIIYSMRKSLEKNLNINQLEKPTRLLDTIN